MLSDAIYKKQSGQRYFDQRTGAITDNVQKVRAQFFFNHIKPTDTVLDFGCGTGGILNAISCKEKFGIEINEPAAEKARQHGINVFDNLQAIEDNSVNVIISNHALEHCADPMSVLLSLRSKLQPNGKLIAVVPAECPFKKAFRFWSENPQNHLYSWTAVSFGNLVKLSGFEILACTLDTTTERGRKIGKIPSRQLRHLAFLLREVIFQLGHIVVVAKKPHEQ